MKKKIDYSLYLVTDRNLMTTDTVEASVEQAILGGCTLVQLREKDISSRAFYDTALAVHKVTKQYEVPLIINDRLDIALAIDAEGVHIGQEDLPARDVRRILGPDKILGVSASRLPEALAAFEDGADYLGVGAMYATSTKDTTGLTGMDELRRIREAVGIPIVVIGGINLQTIPSFRGSGIDGIAVVSALVAQEDIVKAAQELKALFLTVR